MVADAPHLDGQYAAFGKITENAQAAVDISRVNRNMYNDMPKKATGHQDHPRGYAGR